MPRVADLVEAMQDYWRDLVPKNSPYGGRVQLLFNSIHALLSLQLQGLIKRSLDHLAETVEVYKSGNLQHVYNPKSSKLKRRPFMTLIVSVVGKHEEEGDELSERDSALYQIDEDDPNILSMELKSDKPILEERSASFIMSNSGKMIIEPYMEELPDLFKSYFVKILKVGYKIPRLEYYMTQSKELLSYLHYIHEDHVDMLKLYDKIKKIVQRNQTGPTTYLYPMYRFYFPILANKMKHITESIFSLREIPSLQVCTYHAEKECSSAALRFFFGVI
jgi:dynein heavy chain